MLTSKAISTVSWNSDEFLFKVLKRLYEQDIISFYCMVYHFAEEDEKKPHWNIYLIPSHRIDTAKLREEFVEVVSSNDKPLCCNPFENSKFDDWYLYHCHDERYLASKGQTRKYHYHMEDFFASDEQAFIEKIHKMDLSKYNGMERFVTAVKSGCNFDDLVCQGFVPIQLIHQYEKAYNCIRFGKLGGSKGGSLTTP